MLHTREGHDSPSREDCCYGKQRHHGDALKDKKDFEGIRREWGGLVSEREPVELQKSEGMVLIESDKHKGTP
jgi:hypothetical protein